MVTIKLVDEIEGVRCQQTQPVPVHGVLDSCFLRSVAICMHMARVSRLDPHQSLFACNLLSVKLFLPAIFTGHLKGHPLDQSSIYACLRSLCVTSCRLPSTCPTFGFKFSCARALPGDSVLWVCRTSQHQALFACNIQAIPLSSRTCGTWDRLGGPCYLIFP